MSQIAVAGPCSNKLLLLREPAERPHHFTNVNHYRSLGHLMGGITPRKKIGALRFGELDGEDGSSTQIQELGEDGSVGASIRVLTDREDNTVS